MNYGNESSYRRAAVEGASSVSLVIMLYDRMLLDVQRAVTAIRRQDIEGRCAELKHALLILQQLEGSLDHEAGRDVAENLAKFYAYCRSQLMEAQLRNSPDILERLTARVLDVRSAWQQVDPARNNSMAASEESLTLSCSV